MTCFVYPKRKSIKKKVGEAKYEIVRKHIKGSTEKYKQSEQNTKYVEPERRIA